MSACRCVWDWLGDERRRATVWWGQMAWGGGGVRGKGDELDRWERADKPIEAPYGFTVR
jgi:hypothetical protein